MKLKNYVSSVLPLLILLNFNYLKAANITTAATGSISNASVWPITTRTGTFSSNTTSKTVTGTGTLFTTEFNVGSTLVNSLDGVVGVVESIQSNTELTLVNNALLSNISTTCKIKGIGPNDALFIGAGQSITVDIDLTCASVTINTAASLQTSLTLSTNKTLTVNGTFSMPRPSTNGFNCILNVNDGAVTCNALTMSATTTGRDDIINITTGSLTIAGNVTSGTTGCKINLTSTGTLSIGGTVGSFTLTNTGNSTVKYVGTAQTARPITYYNLTLGGSGVKTITSVTVNGTLTFESTATIGAAITYGSSASLKYNTTTNRTVTANEWPATFTATGGVIISSTGIITLNVAKIFNTGVNLTIETGSTLATANLGLTFNGDFINSGTLTAGSSNIIITGTATQSIGKIATTGTITSTKSSGTATFTNTISAGTLTVNGSGSNLSLGSGSFTHNFGNITLTIGTLLGGNSYTNISNNVTRSTGVFTPETSTIDYNGSTQSTVVSTYYDLVLSGSGTKTISSSSGTITNNFTLKGSCTYTSSVAWSIGGNVSILGTSSLSLAAATIAITGNLTVGDGQLAFLIISNTAGSKTISGDFIISIGAAYTNTVDEGMTIGGNFDIQGSATFGNGIYSFTGTSKSISSASAITIPNVTISGTYTNNTNLTISSALSGSGTLTNASNATLNFTTNSITNTVIIATATNNTVSYSMSGAQNIYNIDYYHLNLAGSGIKSFSANTNIISGNLTLSGTASTSFVDAVQINGNLTVNSGSTLTCGAFIHTVNGNISILSGGIVDWTGSSLILSGAKQSYTDANTTPYALNNLQLHGNGLKTINVKSITGEVGIAENDSLLLTATTFTILGYFNIGRGYFKIENATDIKYFTGDVTIKASGYFDNSSHANTEYAGNLTNNGNFIAGAGTYTFTGAGKTIEGSSNISLINITINGTIKNNASIAIGGTLAGSGKLTNANTLFFTSSNTHTLSTFDAKSYVNIVYYSGGAQSLLTSNYYHLSLSGSGVKNVANAIDSVLGDLSISGTSSYTATDGLIILGNLTTSGTPTISFESRSFKIAGNITIGNGTTFNFSNSTMHLNGSSQIFINYTGTELIISALTLSGGIKTIEHNIHINSTLTIDADASISIGSTATLYLNCLINGTGKIMGGTCASLGTKSISFEKTNSNMGTIYIDPSNNIFYRIHIKNNASVNIVNDLQVYDYINLDNGIITINNQLYLSTSNVPIVRNLGFLNLASTCSLTFGGCTTTGSTFTIPTNSFITPPSLAKFTIQRTAGVNIGTNTINVNGVLELKEGNLQTNGLLSITSNSTSTARVAPISSGTISGNVTVERFIPGGSNKRKWRLMSFPINISGSVPFTQLKDNILITAPAGSTGGFDVNPLNPANTASLRTYTESTSGAASNGWTDPSSINSTIATGLGFEVFVRGSRSLANPYLNWTVPDDVTLNYTGELNVGDKTVNLSYTNTGTSAADGFNLVGNPYASPINFDTTGWTKTNIQNKFWSYNPNTGLYGIYDATLQTGTNGITKYIASSQGFFVKATAASPSIKFTENVKCINSGNNYFRPTSASQSIFPMLSISISNDSSYTDETILVFDENSSTLSNDEHDANKWFNDALNLYTISSDKINLNIDSRNYPSGIDSIPLAVYSYNGSDVMTTPHRISINGLHNIPSNIDLVLWDKYLNTYSNLKVNPNYDFTITSENNSWGKNRFIILVGDVNIGVNNVENNSGWRIFPNPAHHSLSITSTSNLLGENIQYKLMDQSGRSIQEDKFNFDAQIKSIDISNLNVGFYFIEISIADKIKRIKFIKE